VLLSSGDWSTRRERAADYVAQRGHNGLRPEMAGERKLGFRVVFASSEDADYPAAELNYHSPQTKGWQSTRWAPPP